MASSLPAAAAAAPAALAKPSIVAFDKAGLKLVMELAKPDPSDPSKTDVLCTFTNSSPADLTSFVFQAAVPKFVQLAMKPPSGSVVGAGGASAVTQVLSVKNTQLGAKTLMFRMKIVYSTGGRAVEEQAQASTFPPGY
jgi:hypothetical protein